MLQRSNHLFSFKNHGYFNLQFCKRLFQTNQFAPIGNTLFEFNRKIKQKSMKDDLLAAIEIKNEMLNHNIQPNVQTLETLINACYKSLI